MEIEASHLEFTDSVLVQGDMRNLTEDILTLYFSNKKRSGGGDIKSLIWVNKQKSVVMSFQDCHGKFFKYLFILKYFEAYKTYCYYATVCIYSEVIYFAAF